MKKLIKFKTVEVVKEVELEIELPAYFIYGSGKPSHEENGYFNIIKVTDPDKKGEQITNAYNPYNPFYSYQQSPWTPSDVVNENRFTQVDESEWDIAVERLIKGIKNGGV